MNLYIKRLKAHPGVPIAAMMTVAFLVAGLANANWKSGLITGAIAAAVVWSVVLWTARTQPLPRGDK